MKEGYKKTEVGVIPDDWEVKSIGKISEVKTGGTPSRNNEDYWENGTIPWMSSGEVNKKRVHYTKEFITELGLKHSNTSLLPKNTIMMALNGQGKTRGMVALLEIESTCNQSLAGIITNKLVNPYYVYYYLESLYEKIRAITGDGARNGLNLALIREIKVGIPPLKEQEKIADILSTADCQIYDTEMLIEKCQELKKGLMQRLLTKGIGHTEFKKTEVGEIPVEWEVVPFESLYEEKIRDFGSFSTTKLIEYVEEGVPYLRSENFRENKLNYETVNKITKKVDELLNKSYVYIDNILFTKIGNIGAAYCYKGELGERCNSNATIAKIKLNREKVVNEYIVYFLISDICKKQYAGDIVSTPPRINMGVISKFRVTVPPIEEQEKISQILISLDKEIEDYKNKKQKLEELKKGLMQQLLTGKLRTIM